MTHGIIFTGWQHSILISPQAGAYRIRTYLEQHGYSIEVIDHVDNWTIPEMMEIIELLYSDDLLFIGFSLSFYRKVKPNVLATIKLRWPHLKLILGAQEFNANIIDGVSIIDKAIYGYSETAMLHYIDFLSGKRKDDLDWQKDDELEIDYIIADKTYPYTNTSDLSIHWKKDDPINQFTTLPLETSRGCIFRCAFCSYPLIGKKKMDYLRSVDNMADELKHNYETFGTTNYSFMDDTLNESVEKLEHLNKAIKKSGVPITFSAYVRLDLCAAFPQMIDILLDMGIVGAYMGIETMHETAKKVVGKGMSNSKIFDAIAHFRSKSSRRIWLEAGLIVGLPSEDMESVLNTNKILTENRYFDHWYWYPLYINRHHRWLLSEFDKNYSKYGYRFNDSSAHWENDHMTFHQAEALANVLNQQNKPYMGISAWVIGHLHSYGMTFDSIEDKMMRDIDIDAMFKRKDRIIEDYKADLRCRFSNHS